MRGQTLVEAVVALGIMALVITALAAATTVAVARLIFAKQQVQAQKYAQEGMEWVRAERENNDWNTFFLPKASGGGTTYCFNTMAWVAVGACTAGAYVDANNTFWREGVLRSVNVAPGPPDPDGVEVKITVSWQSGAQTHRSEQTTYLTNWPH